MNTQIRITGDELIGDILAAYPESEEIMNDYGLHCTSCSVNQFEPLKMGVMSHGIPEEIADELIERLNKLADAKTRAKIDGIYVSGRAAKAIQEFAKAEEKEGWGLRITARPQEEGAEPAYAMDFEEKATKEDKSYEFHGVQIFVAPDSFELLEGAEVDFISTQHASGFKITNARYQKKDGCCGGGACGSGGCGSGGCGCSH